MYSNHFQMDTQEGFMISRKFYTLTIKVFTQAKNKCVALTFAEISTPAGDSDILKLYIIL